VRRRYRLLALLPLTLIGAAPAAAPLLPIPAGTQCLAGERVLYSCRFGKAVGSVCMSAKTVSYRFGPPGHPAIDIRNTADWSNIHVGSAYGGMISQQTVRFTSKGYDYIVYDSEGGQYSDIPGKRFSGIAVMHGKADVANLECHGGAIGREDWPGEVADRANAVLGKYGSVAEDDPRLDDYF
jgi:hypothetical protein